MKVFGKMGIALIARMCTIPVGAAIGALEYGQFTDDDREVAFG